MSKYIAAIELGTTKVATIVGERTSQGVKILGYSEAPSVGGIRRGEVINIQKTVNSLLPTIADVEAQIEGKISSVYVGISGYNVRGETANLRKSRKNEELVSEEEIAQMLEEIYFTRVETGEQVFHVIPQSYNVGEEMYTTDPVGMMGSEVEGNYRLFIGKTSSATHTKSVISRAGLKLEKLMLKPIASASAVLTSDEMELGVVLVNIGGGTTDVLIYHDNIIRHSAVIPFAGKSITEDIRQVCGVPIKYAKRLKETYGSCLSEYVPENKTIIIPGMGASGDKEISNKLLSSTIESRIEEIIATVIKEIDKSNYKKRIRAGIVITGGSANLIHLEQLVAHMTGMPVRIAAPDLDIMTANSVESIFNNPGASTAVGLLVEALASFSNPDDKQEEYEDTLFPREEMPEEKTEVSTEAKGKKREKRTEPRKSVKETIGGIFSSFFEPENEA